MSLEIYLVGGAVRDMQMGILPMDRDYVVVGSSPGEMESLGYSQVGKDFPVFHHPETHEEYALARVERQAGTGHTAFSFSTESVTLEDDLARRDLTINSMALNQETGELTDPFHGLSDIRDKVLRHTSLAFIEDPLRILRVARFLARLGPAWSVAPSTESLIVEMVRDGLLRHLPFERVWKELDRGLMEPHPAEMLGALIRWGAFEDTTGFDRIVAVRKDFRRTLQHLKGHHPVSVRFAAAFQLDDSTSPSALPRDVQDVSDLAQRSAQEGIREFTLVTPQGRVAILDRLDVLRRPERFDLVISALKLIDDFDDSSVQQARVAYAAVDQQALAKLGGKGIAIKARIHEARVAAVTNL